MSEASRQNTVNIELFEAAAEGSVDGVNTALRKGGDPNFFFHPDDQKNSLHVACENGHLEVCKLVIARGANINAIASASQCSPLIFAAQSGSATIVKYLISSGAKVNMVNGYGNSALHTACRLGFIDVIQVLVDAGADCHLRNHKGSSPLHFCGYSGVDARDTKKIIDLLMKNGAHIDDRDSRGNTPLLTACMAGSLDLMNLLIELGADVNAKNNNHEGVVELAKFFNHPDIIKKFSNIGNSQTESKYDHK